MRESTRYCSCHFFNVKQNNKAYTMETPNTTDQKFEDKRQYMALCLATTTLALTGKRRYWDTAAVFTISCKNTSRLNISN